MPVERDEGPEVRARRDASSPPGGRQRRGGADVRILERERELAACQTALDRALAGCGGMVVVEGPPGIGKSELLRVTRERARGSGARVLSARGLEVERELAFGGVKQLLAPVLQKASPEQTARLFSGAASPAARLFEGAARDASATADPAFAVLNALYWVLAGLAETRPLVMMVDDAHWLDLPSLRLLAFLAPRIEELPAVAVFATRSLSDAGEAAPLGRILIDPGSHVIRPDPLSLHAVGELVRAWLGAEPDATFTAACADVTGGNPFYLAELLRELAQRDVRPESGAAAAIVRAVGPRNISLMLRFRIAASPAGVALARALAVLGDDARVEEVAALAGLEREAAAGAADALVRQAILAPGSSLSFAHPIVRTAVYADLAPRERAQAHGRAAQLLHTRGAPIERVAAHLMSTDPARDPVVVEVLRAAASDAVRQGAPEAAAHYLRRALAEHADEPRRAHVLLELARAEASAADPDAAVHLAEAYALAPDARTRADAALLAAVALFSSQGVADALVMLVAVAEELAHEDPERALELEAQLVALAMYEPGTAALYLPRLDRIDEDLPADSTGARMMLCQLALLRLWRSRDAARAAELAERALAGGLLLAERGTDTPELGWTGAGMTLIFADRLDSAARLLEAAAAQASERGSQFGFGLVSLLRGELGYRRGALRDAEADIHTSLEIMSSAGQISAVAWGTGVLIAALLERGALDEAEDALRAVGISIEELPPQPQFSLLLSARGRLRIAQGDVASGLADLLECGRRNQQLDIRHPRVVSWRADAALAHGAQGELDEARALAKKEQAAARDWGTPGTIGAAQRLLGLLNSGEAAIALLQQATAKLAESPARLEYAHTLVDLGAALRRANRRVEAREPLSRGLDLADHCGATVLSRQARDELTATGARPRRVRLTGIDALTASERRVAQMAARGLSNTEIAQTLFVTRKTVEKHLGNAYTKLGTNSRTELFRYFVDASAVAENQTTPDPTRGDP